MLSLDQRDEFERTGLLRLSGVIPAAEANAMADRIWSFLSRQSGVDRNDQATWSTTRPTGFQPVSRGGELDGERSAVVSAAVDDLIATSEVHWERPRVLMTFPDADLPWTVPSAGWHFDYVPRQVQPGLRALQVFAVLNEAFAARWRHTRAGGVASAGREVCHRHGPGAKATTGARASRIHGSMAGRAVE
jgi:hypothetical protein